MKRNLVIAGAVLAIGLLGLWKLRGGEQKETKIEAPAKVTKRVASKRVPGKRGGNRGANREVTFVADDDPAGSLRLEGQVVDATDKPVAGATVILGSTPPRQMKSEDDGSFAFDKLVGRPYRLVARSGNAIAGPITARLTDSNDPVILKLKPAAAVKITVVSAGDKQPISGATVELRSIDVQTAQTGTDGIASIAPVAPGRYAIMAQAPGYAPQHSWARIRGGQRDAAVRLELKRGARVSGVVVSPTGGPIVGARVLYSGASSWGQRAHPRYDAVLTDKKGAFSFPALPAGTFRFTARSGSFAPGTSELITLDGRTERSDLKIELEEGATVRGKVVSKEGEPVATARVRIAVKVAGFAWSRPRQAYADDRGEFVIDGMPRKPLELVALHESGSSEIVVADMTETAEKQVTITIDLTDTISGIVLNSKDEPIEGAQVWAWPDFRKGARMSRGDWRLRGRNVELSDAGGKFVLRGIKPGSYRVRAVPGTSSRRRGGRRTAVEAEAGAKDVKIVLEADGKVKGKVTFANGEAPTVFTVGTGFRGGTPFSDKKGKFELDEVPPGKSRITVRGPGFDTQSVEIDVKPGETTDVGTVTVKKGRTISGRVVANGSPVEGALVRAGRLIFGDGSSAKAGRGGGPMGRSTKEAQTDENGEFTIYGVGLGDISIVAEHDAHGRSKPLAFRQTNASVPNVELALEAFGALEGKVTQDGKPMSKVIVNAQSQLVPGAMFGVSTGADGTFRFDRLAPDTYKISAMIGTPMTGMGFHSKVAVVKSKETTSANLTVTTGGVTLAVTAKLSGEEKTGFVMIYAVRGALKAPATARELNLTISAMSESQHTWAFGIAGNPASVRDLVASSYTVCAIPYPKEVQGMGGTMGYMQREGDNLKVFCKTVAVTEAPAEQAVAIDVEIPTFVPMPTDDAPAGDKPAPAGDKPAPAGDTPAPSDG